VANEEQLAVFKGGRVHWRDWRRKYPNTKPDLSRADLRKRDLRKIQLHGADLTGADLSGCDLRKVDLTGAVLDDAVFTGANVCEVVAPNLRAQRAVLDKADFEELRDWGFCRKQVLAAM
jgi:uncharacterized protein YjbI with pentapeptide repeats